MDVLRAGMTGEKGGQNHPFGWLMLTKKHSPIKCAGAICQPLRMRNPFKYFKTSREIICFALV
jgi:hypothetical protein